MKPHGSDQQNEDAFAILRDMAPAYTEWVKYTLDAELGVTPSVSEYDGLAHDITGYLTDSKRQPLDVKVGAEPKLAVAEGVKSYLARMAIPDETRIVVVGNMHYLRYLLKIRGLPRAVSYEVVEEFSPSLSSGHMLQRRIRVARKVLLAAQTDDIYGKGRLRSLECSTAYANVPVGVVQTIGSGIL